MGTNNRMDYLTLVRVANEIRKKYGEYLEKMTDDKFSSRDWGDKLEITARYSELGSVLAMLTGFMNDAEFNEHTIELLKEWEQEEKKKEKK